MKIKLKKNFQLALSCTPSNLANFSYLKFKLIKLKMEIFMIYIMVYKFKEKEKPQEQNFNLKRIIKFINE